MSLHGVVSKVEPRFHTAWPASGAKNAGSIAALDDELEYCFALSTNAGDARQGGRLPLTVALDRGRRCRRRVYFE